MLYRSLLIGVTVMTLCACNAKQAEIGGVSPSESTRNPVPLEQVEAAGELVVEKEQHAKIEHHERKPQSKPGAQVSLIESQIFLIEPGEQADITLRLHAPQQSGQMYVTVSGSEGLNILAGGTERKFSLSSDHIYELPLRVIAEKSGRYYAHIKVVIESDERPQARVISAIVQSGNNLANEKLQKGVGPAAVGATKESDVEALIVQPARETIL